MNNVNLIFFFAKLLIIVSFSVYISNIFNTIWLKLQSTKLLSQISIKFSKENISTIFLGFLVKENRIYIRVKFIQSRGMNFVSPFQPER